MKKYSKDDLLLFGGNYSNFQASKRLKEIAEELGFAPNQIICNGDIVGYCSQPEETVQLIKEWGIKCITGNVEDQIREGAIDCGCNFDAGSRCDILSKQWFPYAQANLSKDSVDWISSLPTILSFKMNGKNIAVIHGGIADRAEFIFASTHESRKKEIFEELAADIIIGGHSGLPFAQHIDKNTWINPGVVGMPANDGTTRGWFAVLKTATWEIELHSFDYDSTQASQLMTDKELAIPYAKTLLTGIWDNTDILLPQEISEQGVRIQQDKHWEFKVLKPV